jgi:hypothetical protein
MSDQGQLFGEAVEVRADREFVYGSHKLARTSDPSTSHRGAVDVSYRTGSQKARLMDAYRAHPAGLTDEEAGIIAGLERAGYWKRCADLRSDGVIEPTGAERLGSAGSWVMVCRVVA